MPNRKLPSDKQVIDWYASGKSTGEIAEMVGVQMPAVHKLLKRCGVVLRSPKEAALIRAQSGRARPPRYWLGKTQPPEMVENRAAKIRGDKHYLWKGGKDSRKYRQIKTKEFCEVCQSKENLGIHHKDFDHFNNSPDNLQVLCVSCHMSLHKQSYWDAIHNGTIPLHSNGRVGWKPEGGDNE